MDAQLLAELRTLAAAQAQAQAGQEQGAGPAPAASRTRRALQLLLLVLLLACALCCLFRGGRWCGLCAGWCDAVHEAYDAVHDAASDDGSHLPLVASQPPSPTSKRKPPRVCLSLQLLVARARAFARARAGRFGSAAAVGVGGKRESDVEMQPHKRRQTPSRVLQLREAREQRWDSPGMMRGLSLPSLSKMGSAFARLDLRPTGAHQRRPDPRGLPGGASQTVRHQRLEAHLLHRAAWLLVAHRLLPLIRVWQRAVRDAPA
mmetsp:Transcript_20899/g.53004  ORF Transcript_20899/g.53004 Transcript_20899/m.53004 type:complete len:261 (-) Transcript_20899:413-1195(-)